MRPSRWPLAFLALGFPACGAADFVEPPGAALCPATMETPSIAVELAPTCGSCNGQTVCYPGTSHCVKKCSQNDHCEPGHACVATEAGTLCSPDCDSSLCPGSRECVGRRCGSPKCSSTISCPPGEFCDPSVNDCYPMSGACQTSADCPKFKMNAPVDCVEGRCSWKPREPFPLRASPKMEVHVHRPEPASEEDPVILWEDLGDATEVLVLAEPVDAWSSLKSKTIWAAFLPATRMLGTRSVRWSGGTSLKNGAWAGTTCPAPTNEKLYGLVITYRKGEANSTSGLVPFRIGARWQRPGDGCDPARRFCENPWDTLLCQDGVCQVPCGSQRDCDRFDARCGIPMNWEPRLCEF